MIDLKNHMQYHENNCLEIIEAQDNLRESIWRTFSVFAKYSGRQNYTWSKRTRKQVIRNSWAQRSRETNQ